MSDKANIARDSRRGGTKITHLQIEQSGGVHVGWKI